MAAGVKQSRWLHGPSEPLGRESYTRKSRTRLSNRLLECELRERIPERHVPSLRLTLRSTRRRGSVTFLDIEDFEVACNKCD